MTSGAQSTLIGDAWGSAFVGDVVRGDFVRPPDDSSPSLVLTMIVLAVLGAVILVFAVGMKRPGQGVFERHMPRASLRDALLVVGSAVVFGSVLLFARPDESGRTVFFLLVRGYANDSPTSSVALPLVVAALGAAILTFAAGMYRPEQEAVHRLVTRADLERALVILGSALVAVAVVLFTLVPDGPNAPLLDTFGAADTSSGQALRDASITLASLGTVIVAGGAGMKWHGRSMTRTDMERAFLVLGSALVALAVVRVALVGDAMGLKLFLPESLELPNYFPTFLRDSTIILAALGAGFLVIGAVMRTDRRRALY